MNRIPRRMKTWSSAAPMTRFRSARGSLTTLTTGLICHHDEPGRRQFGEKSQEVMLAAVGFDLVLAHDRVSNVSHAGRRLDQRPDSRTDRVQTVVDAPWEMKEGGLATQITPDLLRGGRDRRAL